MSGAEVILGVIPILVEVAEYSHTLYQQFRRWRKYASELGDFQDELYCYQCVFRKDCSLLLRAVTTTAEFDWIWERDVTKLENPELERKLMSYLDDQYFYCGVLMEKIKKELDVLDAKSQRFQDAIAVPESVSTVLLYVTRIVICCSPPTQPRLRMIVPKEGHHGGPSE
jgi:hypothetical protein